MRSILHGGVISLWLLIGLANRAVAVVGQSISIQGTNLVLSWPSQGYEYYLVQYRPSLDPSTPWIELTNNYPANSTNLTTYVIPCCTIAALYGGSGMLSMLNQASSSRTSISSGTQPSDLLEFGDRPTLWMTPANQSGGPAPLFLYPPGYDTNGFILFEAPMPGKDQTTDSLSTAGLDGGEAGGPLSLSSGGCDCPDMGFFRVFHIPDFAANITNFTFDGPIFIPVDFKDYRERVDNIEVLLDGQPIADAVFTSLYYSGQTNWGMGIYFDLFPSGTHQIQLRSTLRLNDEIGDSTVYLALSNLTRNIVVDNQVMFTNWNGMILSSNFTFRAQTKAYSTDWWIDIYDAWNNYINVGSGHTSNGQIVWTWDLRDYLGNTRDNLDTDPFFQTYITFDTASAGQGTRPTPAPIVEYPDIGNWLVTYSDKHIIDAGSNYSGGNQYYIDGVNAIGGGIALKNIPFRMFPIEFGTNSYTQQQRDDSWIDLKAFMFQPQSRNFYYHGHGGANTIGTDVHVFDTNGYVTGGRTLPGSKAFLTSQIVSNLITFNRYNGAKPYRFVWLDGCSTANGNWPGAFGMAKSTNDLGFYTNSVTNPQHRRPSVFVGWNQTVGGQGWGTIQGTWFFHSEWISDWSANDTPLTNSFANARRNASWPPGGDQQLFGALRVYGYTVMKFNEFNRKTDWRWP